MLCSVLNIQSHGSSVITTCVGSQKAKRARLCCNLNIDGLRLNTSFLLHGRRKKEKRKEKKKKGPRDNTLLIVAVIALCGNYQLTALFSGTRGRHYSQCRH